MSAALVLEDGTVFSGESVGAEGFAFGEAVFTTSMSGYQEVATDPSFEGQLVCFTAPMVGNYGVDEARSESRRSHARAVVMREARGPHWTDWLHEHGIVGLTGVDTRSLVLHLRDRGAMRAAAVSDASDVDEVLTAVRTQPEMAGAALVAGVSTDEAYTFTAEGTVRVAVVDYGCKRSILRRLASAGAAVDVFPHDVDADTLAGYDGVLLSPGTGRSRTARRRGADSRRLARAHTGARCLSRSSAARTRDRSRDVQAAVRAPRRESSRARPPQQPGARHLAEPRLRGRCRRRDRPSRTRSLYDGTVEGLSYPTERARSAQFHPGGDTGAARRVRRSSPAGSTS